MSHTPHVVLVGGGHAHLQVIRGASALRAEGARVSVICPRHFWYSGLATAVLSGSHEPADDCIDIADLAQRRGVDWIDSTVTAIAVADRSLTLADGSTLSWDRLSLNVGSEVALPGTPAADDRILPVKPIANVAALRARLEGQANGTAPRILVIGGGPTGCEVTANLATLCTRVAPDARITLAHHGERLLPAAPAGAGRHIEASLRHRGVHMRHGASLTITDAGKMRIDGEPPAADILVPATGLRAVELARSLAIDGTDGVPVTTALHHPAHPEIFAAGDCAHFLPRPLPKVGVFGVRQGPILLHNLAASLARRPLRPFQPQRRYLTILNLGNGTGLALRGGWWWHGRMMLRLKHFLDHRFLLTHRC